MHKPPVQCKQTVSLVNTPTFSRSLSNAHTYTFPLLLFQFFSLCFCLSLSVELKHNLFSTTSNNIAKWLVHWKQALNSAHLHFGQEYLLLIRLPSFLILIHQINKKLERFTFKDNFLIRKW